MPVIVSRFESVAGLMVFFSTICLFANCKAYKTYKNYPPANSEECIAVAVVNDSFYFKNKRNDSLMLFHTNDSGTRIIDTMYLTNEFFGPFFFKKGKDTIYAGIPKLTDPALVDWIPQYLLNKEAVTQGVNFFNVHQGNEKSRVHTRFLGVAVALNGERCFLFEECLMYETRYVYISQIKNVPIFITCLMEKAIKP